MGLARIDAAELHRIRRRHAEVYCEVAIDAADDLLGPRQGSVSATLDAELPDLWGAMSFLRETRDWSRLARMTAALSRYWYARFLGWEGRRWLMTIPRDQLDDADRARLEEAAGFLAWAVHDYVEADRHHSAALAEGRRIEDRRIVADALHGLGLVHQKRRFKDGAAMLEEAARIYASLPGCERQRGESLLFRGLDEVAYGDPRRGAELLREAVRLMDASGYRRQISKAERWLSHAAWREDKESEARDLADRAEVEARRSSDRVALAGALIEQANIEIRWGKADRAASRLAEAISLIPHHDEVDLSQVVLPVARLAAAVGNRQIGGLALAYIDDVYDRMGWRTLDEVPDVEELRTYSEPCQPPDTGAMVREVTGFLASITSPGRHRVV